MLAKLKVVSVLESLPGVGKVRARRIMAELDISESRRLRGLGRNQREGLLVPPEDRAAGPDLAVLLVIAGPSGVGKGTVVRKLLERDPSIWLSVSATTRAPRPGEVDGVDYRFLTPDEFEALRDAGGFLEWFEVYGHLKGTPRAPGRGAPGRGRGRRCWRSTSRARWRSGRTSPTRCWCSSGRRHARSSGRARRAGGGRRGRDRAPPRRGGGRGGARRAGSTPWW